MVKIISSLVILLFACSMLLERGIITKAAAPENINCADGALLLNPPAESVPTYDYDAEGFLQFHFQVKPEGWPYTINKSILEYNTYTTDCTPAGTLTYPFIYANRLPLIPHFTAKVVSFGPNQYNFIGINEDTGQQIPNAFGSLPPNFSSHTVLSMKFYAVGNFGTGPAQSAIITPAVPVKINVAKTPVLIVPGVLGTEISKDGELLWADLSRMSNPLNSDAFMDPLAFNEDLTSITNVSVGQVISKKSLLAFNFDYTQGLISEFQNLGYTENQDLFTLPYDWRYGVGDVNIQALKNKIAEIRTQTGSDKVDIIAHSTGGLIVKKYVMDNDDHHIRKALFVGVPNLGAPKAIKTLVDGDNFDVIGLSSTEMKKISANMPVVYDLAPSQKYYTLNGSYYKKVISSFTGSDIEYLDHQQLNNELVNKFHLNAQAITNAENLHTINFDNLDLRTKGIDAYNIVGCKLGTIGPITEYKSQGLLSGLVDDGYEIAMIPGDKTVPMESATNFPVNPENKFYIIKGTHGELMTGNGSRQLITNLIASGQAPTGLNNITQDINHCKLNGRAISIFSPLTLDITDQNNNHARVAPDGSIEDTIDGVTFETFGEHTFAFIDDDIIPQVSIAIKGTGTGEYTLKVDNIQNDVPVETQVFNHQPVTPTLTGSLNLQDEQAVLSLDTDGNGSQETTLTPNATLTSAVSDILPPATNLMLSGPHNGTNQIFTGPVTINLQAIDTAQDGVDASGVYNIQYSLDGAPVRVHTAPFRVAQEGQHSITYFATDLAGNRELQKTQTFTVDGTPPEVVTTFDPVQKTVIYTPTDISPTTIQNTPNGLIAIDSAGNTTEITIKQKNTKSSITLNITGIKYNGVVSNVTANKLLYSWVTSPLNGQLISLLQQISTESSKNLYSSIYNGTATVIVISSTLSGQTTTQNISGLALSQTTTSHGQLVVSTINP